MKGLIREGIMVRIASKRMGRIAEKKNEKKVRRIAREGRQNSETHILVRCQLLDQRFVMPIPYIPYILPVI